jgi:hypothetical protein
LQEGQSAYVIITNMYFHRALQSDQPSQAILAHGLGNDFWLADHVAFPKIPPRFFLILHSTSTAN